MPTFHYEMNHFDDHDVCDDNDDDNDDNNSFVSYDYSSDGKHDNDNKPTTTMKKKKTITTLYGVEVPTTSSSAVVTEDTSTMYDYSIKGDYSHREFQKEQKQQEEDHQLEQLTKDMATDDSSSCAENDNNNNNHQLPPNPRRQISISALVQCLGEQQHTLNLPPELERRVRDFRLAQSKRVQKYGYPKRWGIFGMYAHLMDIRTDLEWAEDAAWRRQHEHPYLAWSDFETLRKHAICRPWFTYAIIGLCTIMLIVEFALNDWKMAPLSINPMLGPSADALIQAGARDTTKIVQQGQWFRLFSPLVLHAGIIHYFINVLALWFIGAAVEQSHGVVATTVLFMIPGVGGNILSAIFLPQYISVGASGGIFGLIGACVADICLNWNLLFIKQRSDENDRSVWKRNFGCVFWLVLEVIINIILGLVTPFIDNWTHLGGLVYGACCAFSLLPVANVSFLGVNNGAWSKVQMLIVRFFGLIVTLVLVMVTTVWLATSDPTVSSPCPKCRYISCVPFPFFQEDKWWYCDDCDFVTANLFKDESAKNSTDNSTTTTTSQQQHYTRVDLTCPDQTIEMIDVSEEKIHDREQVRKNLPSYCRDYCENVFN